MTIDYYYYEKITLIIFFPSKRILMKKTFTFKNLFLSIEKCKKYSTIVSGVIIKPQMM